MDTPVLHPPLTNLQLELLKLFGRDVPEEQLLEIRDLLARYFAERATEAMDRIVEERGLTPDDIERWAHEHHRATRR